LNRRACRWAHPPTPLIRLPAADTLARSGSFDSRLPNPRPGPAALLPLSSARPPQGAPPSHRFRRHHHHRAMHIFRAGPGRAGPGRSALSLQESERRRTAWRRRDSLPRTPRFRPTAKARSGSGSDGQVCVVSDDRGICARARAVARRAEPLRSPPRRQPGSRAPGDSDSVQGDPGGGGSGSGGGGVADKPAMTGGARALLAPPAPPRMGRGNNDVVFAVPRSRTRGKGGGEAPAPSALGNTESQAASRTAIKSLGSAPLLHCTSNMKVYNITAV
jgi:hypothetical protein